MSHESNGHISVEEFRDLARRKKSTSRLDELWEDFNRRLPPEAVPKVLPKATRVYDARRRELEKSTKSQAHKVINTDRKISLQCLVGKLGCAVLSSYLNAQHAVLGMKMLLNKSPELLETLQTTYVPCTSIPFITMAERAVLVYGVTISWMVLLLWAVAGAMLKRGNYRVARWTGGAGLVALLLSLWDCTHSLMVFGQPWPLALAWALAIDAGLVSFEISSLFSSDVLTAVVSKDKPPQPAK